ncbi:MAG TPA: hypothetical protein VHA75_03495, partial [Rugosimonospora sp.]|nr:hypothetical protein [Rugosimonospora sp.]
PVAPPGTPPGQVGGVVSAFGDSVLLGAAPALRTVMPGLSLHATVGIQAAVVFRQVRAAGAGLGPIVLIHTGNNGVVSRSDLDRLLTQLAGEQLVVVVNDHLPRSWQGPNNRTFAAVVPGHANAVLVDWYGAANGHPEWFTPDRVHLRPAGARAYATLIAGQIAARLAAATNG